MFAKKCLVWCFWFLCLSEIASAQQPQYAFSVFFNNKKGALSLSKPSLFLSPRAIQRRANQHIAIDSADLPVSPAYIDSVTTLTSGTIHLTSKWINACVVLLTDSSKILSLQGKPYIKKISQIAYYPTGIGNRSSGNGKFNTEHSTLTTNTANRITGSAVYYGNTYNQTALVNGDYLHDGGYKGQGKLIAVLDAGYSGVNTHPGFDSLIQTGRLVDKYNFTLDTNFVFGYDDHGTSVLSTMAGYIPGTYVGSAPLAEYALYITEDDRSEQPIEMYNLAAASERADSIGADVISLSLGYNLFDNPAYNLTYDSIDGKSTVAAIAVNTATQKGILYVPTAGNEGVGDEGWYWILTPGDADSGLTVGAVDINNIPVGFSGYGPNSAGQIKPDVCDLGAGVSIFTSTGLGAEDGTSFSTPMIAGWAACLMQTVTNPTPYAIRNAIIKSADHYTDPGKQLGYGVPDFKKALQILNVKDTTLPPVDSLKWIVVSPNPFINTINLKIYLSLPQQVDFMLINAAGKSIYKHSQTVDSWNNPNVTLNFSYLPAGMYILKVATNGKKETIKLIKE